MPEQGEVEGVPYALPRAHISKDAKVDGTPVHYGVAVPDWGGDLARLAVNKHIVMMQKAYRYLPMTTVNECWAGNVRGICTNIRSTIATKQK